ncbi:unnamed protein product, partial [Musa acuminata var. zebrina]
RYKFLKTSCQNTSHAWGQLNHLAIFVRDHMLIVPAKMLRSLTVYMCWRSSNIVAATTDHSKCRRFTSLRNYAMQVRS